MAGDSTRAAGRRWLTLAVIALTLAGAGVFVGESASAQGWQWPWETDSAPPRPREPMRRERQQPPPYGAPQYGNPQFGPQQQSNRGGICLQLEQRLAQEANRGSQDRANLPQIEQGIRDAARTVRTGEAQLERMQCYEYFLFSKSLRRSNRRCVQLHNDVEQAKETLSGLEGRRQQIFSTSSRSYRDEIVRELARNNCGDTYTREARRFSNPFSSIWQDEGGNVEGGNRFGELPFATYRTICVRLCDGYYFPVSFSTLPNHFERDAQVCQSKCAAPSELYFHQNPGAGVDQAVSHVTKQPYSTLRTAFKYRKEFVQGCSCKSAEYIPQDQLNQQPANKRAEAPGFTSGRENFSPRR
ncbi:MAG: hypothetical protein RLZ98_3106 [Pseudomonadota bacterium]|jgi:hypothetical protein